MNEGQIQRAKMGKGELLERVLEAALDQRRPSAALTRALQEVLTFTKHRLRDRSRDRREE